MEQVTVLKQCCIPLGEIGEETTNLVTIGEHAYGADGRQTSDFIHNQVNLSQFCNMLGKQHNTDSYVLQTQLTGHGVWGSCAHARGEPGFAVTFGTVDQLE